MALLLFFLLTSFFISSFIIIPFINLLYKLKFQRQKQQTKDSFGRPTPIFDKFHKEKAGIPVGGGLLIIVLTTILFFIVLMTFHYLLMNITSIYPLIAEIKILIFTFISFGFLGLYDDLKKTFVFSNEDFFGLRIWHKLLFELIISLAIAYWLYNDLKIHILNIPFFGIYDIGFLYIPFAMLIIVAFANAFNITDGLDGLAAGTLLVCLIAFWFLSASILDTPLSIFIAIWLGSLIAFLYFNIYPARIFLGDVGALSFGATLAVTGLLLGKTLALPIIGGVFVAEATTSLMQIFYKRILKRKFMKVAPLHLWLQYRGWEEPKIVMRFWLSSIVLAIFGVFLSLLTKQ